MVKNEKKVMRWRDLLSVAWRGVAWLLLFWLLLNVEEFSNCPFDLLIVLVWKWDEDKVKQWWSLCVCYSEELAILLIYSNYATNSWLLILSIRILFKISCSYFSLMSMIFSILSFKSFLPSGWAVRNMSKLECVRCQLGCVNVPNNGIS